MIDAYGSAKAYVGAYTGASWGIAGYNFFGPWVALIVTAFTSWTGYKEGRLAMRGTLAAANAVILHYLMYGLLWALNSGPNAQKTSALIMQNYGAAYTGRAQASQGVYGIPRRFFGRGSALSMIEDRPNAVMSWLPEYDWNGDNATLSKIFNKVDQEIYLVATEQDVRLAKTFQNLYGKKKSSKKKSKKKSTKTKSSKKT